MTLSYTQASGDNFLITNYVWTFVYLLRFCASNLRNRFSQFDLLDQWTQFLITDSLIPANQISTDDFAGSLANQTNLAIKGIVGIKAMSVIAGMVGDTARESNYSVSSGFRWMLRPYIIYYNRFVVHRLLVCHAIPGLRPVEDG